MTLLTVRLSKPSIIDKPQDMLSINQPVS